MTDDELKRLADKIALAVADELDKRDKLKKQGGDCAATAAA